MRELLQRRASRKQKRSKNWEKAQVKVARLHHKIGNTRKDFHLKTAHQLCDQADSIFVEDIDYRVMAKGFLGKHTLDASFGQFRELLKWVCWKRGLFFAQVNHSGATPRRTGRTSSAVKRQNQPLRKTQGNAHQERGTSKQCPRCGTEWDNNLSIRWHTCDECGYSNNRDLASAEVICHRGIEKYPRTIG